MNIDEVTTRVLENSKALNQIWCRLIVCVQSEAITDVVYLHGLSKGMLDSVNLFEATAQLVLEGRARCVAYNGSDGRGTSPESVPGSVWDGAGVYRADFLKNGIPTSVLFPTRPAFHTREETDAFIELAKEQGWQAAYIATVPYHWPRALTCLVASMAKYEHRIKIHFLRPEKLLWNSIITGSQGNEAAFSAEAGDDALRLFSYWDKGREDDGQAWRQQYGAPPEEIHRYLDWFDTTID